MFLFSCVLATEACSRPFISAACRKIVFVYSQYSPNDSDFTVFTTIKRLLFFLCNFDQSNQGGILFQLCQLIFLCTLYVIPVYMCGCILERRGKKCIVEKNLLQKNVLSILEVCRKKF